MTSQSNPLADTTIRNYRIKMVQEEFPDDFHLVEHLLPDLCARLSLKELLLVCRVEIDMIKNRKFNPAQSKNKN